MKQDMLNSQIQLTSQALMTSLPRSKFLCVRYVCPILNLPISIIKSKLLNEILIKVSGEKFNPVGFVADENHANWISLNNIFWKEVIDRVVSCEFHYKQSVQRHAKGVVSSNKLIISIGERMLTALSMTRFELISSEMQSFISKHNILSVVVRSSHTHLKCSSLL